MTSVQDASLLLTDPDRLRRERVIDALKDIVQLDDSADFRKAATKRFLDLTNPEIQEPDL